MLRRTAIVFAAIVALLGGLAAARADDIVITVNKSTQRLHVVVNGAERYDWPVSTAREGYNTPNGVYGVERMAVSWYSRRYDWSPMPHSIFFHGGYAIHGSYEISRIGTPASHGCIRLHPGHAAVLYSLVERNRSSTRIVVTGERPSRDMALRAQRYYGEERPARAMHHEQQRVRYGDEDDSDDYPRARYRRPPRSFDEIFN